MKTLVTHNGPFHADDILATVLFFKTRQIFGDKAEWRVLRSRDIGAIKDADVAVDVGGVHNPSERRFDHHQDKNAEKASAGMVYDHFCGTGGEAEAKYWETLKDLVRGVDQADLGKGDSEFSEFISKNNLTWKEKEGKSHEEIAQMEDSRFGVTVKNLEKAVEKTIRELDDVALAKRAYPTANQFENNLVRNLREGEMGRMEERWNEGMTDALGYFKDAVKNGAEAGVAILAKPVPWQELASEDWISRSGDPLYQSSLEKVAYVKDVSREGSIAWLTVPAPNNKFQPKIPFPDTWRGLRGNALVDAMNKSIETRGKDTRIPHFKTEEENAVFCHGGGFFMCAPGGKKAPEAGGDLFHRVVEETCREQVKKVSKDRNDGEGKTNTRYAGLDKNITDSNSTVKQMIDQIRQPRMGNKPSLQEDSSGQREILKSAFTKANLAGSHGRTEKQGRGDGGGI